MQKRSASQRTPTYDLGDRVALITGGLGGAGQPMTRAFVAAGATVVVGEMAGNETRAAALHSELGAGGNRLFYEPADLQKESEVEALIARILQQHERLDILVNLVGGWRAGEPVTNTDLALWQQMLDLNLRPAFLLSKHAARPMAEQGWGRIIHTSARGALSGRRNAAAYATAKSAVITLVQVQAEELRETGVTVNAILPSIIDTPANRAAIPNADFSKWPKAEEIARVLLFLATEDAMLISGASIPVYGQA
jgi:NAD(P)-dependent dehydrogenase (short-subunit alcohol dehydrogenase family)